MPTNKPKIQTIVDKETHEKFQKLAKKEMRSDSQMASYIITKYIEQYEKEQGALD